MLGLVIVPAIIVFFISMAISALELSPIFQIAGILFAVIVVFFFSNSIFDWGNKRAGGLSFF